MAQLDETTVVVAGATASGDFPTTVPPKSAAQKNIVKADASSADKIQSSDGGVQVGIVSIVSVAGALECPDSKTFTENTVTGNEGLVSHAGQFAGSVDCQPSGQLPPGVTGEIGGQGGSFFGLGFGTGTTYDIQGHPTADAKGHQYTYTLTFTRGKCTWTYTYIINVL